jgi:hypothetical protein
MVYGTTDSEHLAALYLTYLTEGSRVPDLQKGYPKEAMRKALLRAVEFVHKQQRALKLDAFEESELENIYKSRGDFDWASNINICTCT